MNLEKLLKQLGFSTNEAKVYLATLEAGVDSAQHIAKIASLQRTTTYSVLKVLVQKGVVGKTKERGKFRYVAEAPDKLLSLASDIKNKIKKALPQLEAIHNKSEVKPKIVFYEGDEAILNVYEDTLREKPKEILEWNTNKFFEKFPKYNYVDKRVALNIHAKRIGAEGSQWQTEHKRNDDTELSETLIVPKNIFNPDIEVNIYNNKVAFMNYADNMSIIIENEAIAQAMRQAYLLSWRGAKSTEVKNEELD